MNRPPRVLAICGGDASGQGPNLWRVLWPYTWLSEHGFIADWTTNKDPNLDAEWFVNQIPLRYDAIVLPRMSWDNQAVAKHYIDSLHRAGLAVIYELDDDVLSPGIEQRMYEAHADAKDRGIPQLAIDRINRVAAMQLCDGVTCSSARLATMIRAYTDKPVCVVPNFIDAEHYKRAFHGVARLKELEGHTTVGWFGGARPGDDLVMVAEAWKTIAERYPDVRFVVQGYIAPELERSVPAWQRVTLPWLPIDQYMCGLVNVDIGCASVADLHFNRCKTPIKFFEYTLGGAVTVASPTLYKQVIDEGRTGFIASMAYEWECALDTLIASPSLRKATWKMARRNVMESHALSMETCSRWLSAWETIVDDFRERNTRASTRLVLAR